MERMIPLFGAAFSRYRRDGANCGVRLFVPRAMMYYLSMLSRYFGPLRVFEYSTFRGLAAALTAFLISFLFGKQVIRKLISLKFGQPVRTREEVNLLFETHGRKKGTPTMGGVLIIGSVVHRCSVMGTSDQPARCGWPSFPSFISGRWGSWMTIIKSSRRTPKA